MTSGDPFKFPELRKHLDNFQELVIKLGKQPFTGVTQGGSSRKSPGAKPAATSVPPHNTKPI